MKRFLSVSNLRLAFEVLLILALLFVAFSHINTTKAAPSQAPEAPDALYWYQCNGPNHVGLFTNRVHVYCSSITPISGAPALTSIHWFAVPTSPDSAEASRFMSLLQTSVITSRAIWVEANPTDTSGSKFGCGSADCRHIYGMEMR